jgi:multidrug resistance efflux pump
VSATFLGDMVEVIAPPELMDEVKKLLEQIGAKEIAGATRGDFAAGSQRLTAVFRLQHAQAAAVLQRLRELMKEGASKDVTIETERATNSVIISAPEPYFAELKQLVQSLDKVPAVPTRSVDRQLLELDLAQAKLELERADSDFTRVKKLEANKQVSQAEVAAAQYAVAAAQSQVQKAEAKLQGSAAPATRTAANPLAARAASAAAPPSKATDVKLLELDLAEAKLSLDEAEHELSRVQQLRTKNVITEQEVRPKQLAVERAKIQVARIMLKLAGAKEGKWGGR